MSPKKLAVLVAALALPLAAQSAIPTADPRPGVQVQQDKAKGDAKIVAKADGKATPKERARLAKSQNKQGKKVAKQKQDAQKRPPAG